MGNNYYEVKSGDTLWGICKKQFGLNSKEEIAKKVAEVAKNNCIFNGNISVGQKICLSSETANNNSVFTAQEELVPQAPSENEQPVTKQAAETSTTTASESTNQDKNAFIDCVKSLWAGVCFYNKDKSAAAAEAEGVPEPPLIDPSEIEEPEEKIPEGYQLAPNGKITKIYTQKEINEIINETAKRYRIDPSIIKAIISVESSNDQFAESRVGAQGLMQLMPGGAGKGLENAYDVRENIDRGVKEFVRLRRFYGNDTDALRAYNWGEGNYNKYLNGEIAALPPETEQYAGKVFSQQRYAIASV